jgi:hypothetical protein
MLNRLMEKLQEHAQASLDSSVQGEIAQKLGWVLVSGLDAALAKPVLTLVTDADKAGAEVLQDNEKYDKEKAGMEKTLKLFEAFPGANLITGAMQVVCGVMKEQSVYVFPGVEGGSENTSSRRKLDIVALFSNSLEMKLHMYSEQWYSKLGKVLFRLQDIHISDQKIDEAFMIKGEEPRLVGQFLRTPEILGAIHNLLDAPYETPVINDVAVRNTIYYPVDSDQAIEHIKQLVELAAAISEHQSSVG